MIRPGRSWQLSIALLVAVAGVMLSLDTPLRSAPQIASGLFASVPPPAPGALANQPAAADQSVVRQRAVTLNPNVLPDPSFLPQSGDPGSSLPLNLFDDVFYTAALERVTATARGIDWVGHVDGVPLSTVTFIVDGETVAGSIVMPGAAYAVRQAGGRGANGRPLYLISQIDQSALPPERPPRVINAAAFAADPAATAADSGGTIDVLVVYTPGAAVYSHGDSGITALITLGGSETNTSYANSGITQRLQLVNTSAVPYAETGDMDADLTNLVSGASGLSGVAGLRNTYGADLVMMVIAPGSTACGEAFLMTTVSTSFAPNAYSVVSADCISPNYTFAHELGHNMGARHDWYVDSGNTTLPYTYAHGYVNPSAGQHWRTVMAYNDMCAVQGFGCTRVLYWSNPFLTYPPTGAPMGVPAGTKTGCEGSLVNIGCDADDHAVLNNTAFTVANFRQSVSIAAPVITQQPASVSVTAGQTATFTAAATGSPTPTVQWQLSTNAGGTWTNIGGATGTTYAFATTAADNGSWFRAVFTNSGGSTATSAAVLTVTVTGPPPGQAPAVADFNGDGKPDLIWQDPSTGAVLLWTMNNSSYGSSTILTSGGTLWQIVGVGDFTGDGKPDLVWQHPATGAVLLWIMNGTTYVGSAMLGADGTFWQVVGVNDFTSDGKPDLLWQHPSTGAVLLWTMNGTSYLSSTIVNAGGTLWKVAGTGNFNGDNSPDIIWQDPSTGAVLVWFMNGAAYTSGIIISQGGTLWRIAAVADYSGDGNPDLVWQMPSTGELLLWTMNGASYVGSTMLTNGGTMWKLKAPR